MSDVHVIIRGLAFCRPITTADGKGMTQILFPHAPNHRLSLSISRRNSNGHLIDTVSDELYRENFMVMSSENGAEFTTPPPLSTGTPLIKDLVDLVALHRRDPQAIIRFRPRTNTSPPPTIPISYLSLPTNQLYSGAYSESNHELWVHRTNPASQPPLRTRSFIENTNNDHLAVEATTSFSVPAPQGGVVPAIRLQMRPFISVPPPDPQQVEPFIRSHPFLRTPDPANPQLDINYIVVFDNHCNGQSSGADFGYYYEMLEGIDNAGNNVEIEEFPVNRFLDGFPDSEAPCNPVVGDTGCNLENWHRFLGC